MWSSSEIYINSSVTDIGLIEIFSTTLPPFLPGPRDLSGGVDYVDEDLPPIRGGGRDLGGGDNGPCASFDGRDHFFEPQIEIPVEQKTFVYYLLIVVYIVIVILSLTFNSLLIRLIIKLRNVLLKRYFYVLLLNLLAANLLSGMSHVVCSFPVVTFLNSTLDKDTCSSEIGNYSLSTPYAVFNYFNILSEHLVLFLSVLIAVHRFVVFFAPSFDDFLAKKWAIRFLSILAVWLLAIGIAITMFSLSCFFKYERVLPAFKFICSNLDMIDTLEVKQVYLAIKIAVPVAVLVIYVCICLKIVVLRKLPGSRSAELKLLIQSIFIFAVFEGSTILSLNVFLTEQLEEKWVFLAKRVLGTVETLAAMLVPLFVLTTSADLRNAMVSMVSHKSPKTRNTRQTAKSSGVSSHVHPSPSSASY